LILKSYYYFDSEAILLSFELIVIVSLMPLSVSVRCMSHLNKIYYYYYYYYCRETSLSQIVVDNQVWKSHRISGPFKHQLLLSACSFWEEGFAH